jgi:hypothetical protein
MWNADCGVRKGAELEGDPFFSQTGYFICLGFLGCEPPGWLARFSRRARAVSQNNKKLPTQISMIQALRGSWLGAWSEMPK